LVAQAAMKTHLSQSIGAGALVGQHGMSPAISSVIADADISSAVAAIDAVPAMTGRDNGANTSPAIMKIASSQRMVIWRFTSTKSHRTAQIDSPRGNDAVIVPRNHLPLCSPAAPLNRPALVNRRSIEVRSIAPGNIRISHKPKIRASRDAKPTQNTSSDRWPQSTSDRSRRVPGRPT
jgi:hypothetical protein